MVRMKPTPVGKCAISTSGRPIDCVTNRRDLHHGADFVGRVPSSFKKPGSWFKLITLPLLSTAFCQRVGLMHCLSHTFLQGCQLVKVSRPLFGLGLTVTGLGLGLGLMKSCSQSHMFWSHGLKSITCSSSVMTSDCVLCSINTHIWSL